jgi:hypothetical protein
MAKPRKQLAEAGGCRRRGACRKLAGKSFFLPAARARGNGAIKKQ